MLVISRARRSVGDRFPLIYEQAKNSPIIVPRMSCML